jgi:hypothetical protein
MIANIDENFGRLEARLKELELDDNTILIFMTDNGTAAGTGGENGYGAGMHGRKGSQYDGGHRVPFFIRWPDVLDSGRDVEQLTAHIDIVPTLIDLCGLKKPAKVNFDGMSIACVLKNSDCSWPERTLITDSQRVDHPQKWRKSSVMTERWRLIDGNKLYDIKADPTQSNDISNENPDVVKRLRVKYDKWWQSTSQRFNEYCSTIIGSDAEKITTLTSHDWHGDGPWNQEQIHQGRMKNSFWAIDVEQTGQYEISLRRWPAEADITITAAPDGGKALAIKKARLKIANFDKTIDVSADDKAAMFRMKLKAGPTRLQSWFTDADGTSRGAYYVYVRRLS